MSDVVGRIMDKAEHADRRALFAALQAAVLVMVDGMHMHRSVVEADFDRVEQRLDIGVPYGAEQGSEFL